MFTDEEILFKLGLGEDSLVERKTYHDKKDWLKTVVAFANSTPLDGAGILFIGVRDKSGEIEDLRDLDQIQKTLNETLASVYPKVHITPRIMEKDGRQFLAVIVRGSPDRPHFAGASYVRKGSQTFEATQVQIDGLIAERSSKQYELRKWLGKTVTLLRSRPNAQSYAHGGEADLVECNKFWVSLLSTGNPVPVSYPIDDVKLAFDHTLRRLTLYLPFN